MRLVLRILVFGVIAAGVAYGAYYLYQRYSNKPKTAFRTALVKLGDLKAAINSTGTVEPEEVVDVGAQVAGLIKSFGKDVNGKPIDYGSVVDETTVLARIDDCLYAADAALAKASLEQAKAGLLNAKANLEQMKAKLVQAQADWDRAQKLGPSSEALAPTAYDAYRANYDISKANVAVADAAVAQAAAAIGQSSATLDRAQRNQDYCTIKSPVKGVIIDRRVNIGQTVVSSLNAPSLFLIAKDLKRMQVWVAVNEADVGSIYPGQPVTFKVDAFPGEVFLGEVGMVRLNATSTQNVVTYTVEVVTDNSSGRLLPYLTANVDFEKARRTNVLMVPNVALRWTPQLEQVAPEFRDQAARNLQRRGDARPQGASRPAAGSTGSAGPRSRPARPPATAGGARGGPRRGIVWVLLESKLLRPIDVRAGITDGINTEVQGTDLKEGMEVVTGEQMQAADGNKTVNPFTPQIRRGPTPRPGAGPNSEGRTGGGGGPPPR